MEVDIIILIATTHYMCSNARDVVIMGTNGTAYLGRRPRITGENAWQPIRRQERNSHQLEHDAQMESDTRVPPVDSLVKQHDRDA